MTSVSVSQGLMLLALVLFLLAAFGVGFGALNLIAPGAPTPADRG